MPGAPTVTGVIDRGHGMLEVRFSSHVLINIWRAHGRSGRVYSGRPFKLDNDDTAIALAGYNHRAYQRAALKYFLQGWPATIRLDHDGDCVAEYEPPTAHWTTDPRGT